MHIVIPGSRNPEGSPRSRHLDDRGTDDLPHLYGLHCSSLFGLKQRTSGFREPVALRASAVLGSPPGRAAEAVPPEVAEFLRIFDVVAGFLAIFRPVGQRFGE